MLQGERETDHAAERGAEIVRPLYPLCVQHRDGVERQVLHPVGRRTRRALPVSAKVQRNHPVAIHESFDLRRVLGAREDLRMPEQQRGPIRIAMHFIDGSHPVPLDRPDPAPVHHAFSLLRLRARSSKKAAATRCGSPSR